MTVPAPAVTEAERDAAFLALINAHRTTSDYSALPDLAAVRAAYMGSKTDGMGERWLEHERRKSDAAVDAALAAMPSSFSARLGRRSLEAFVPAPPLPGSRPELDRMGEAIRALPGSPVVGRAIGDGR